MSEHEHHDQDEVGRTCRCGRDHSDMIRDAERTVKEHVAAVEAAAEALAGIQQLRASGTITAQEARRARAATALPLGASTGRLLRTQGAPEAVAAMGAAIAATSSLHQPDLDDGTCMGCTSDWPCPTITTLSLDDAVAANVQSALRDRAARW